MATQQKRARETQSRKGLAHLQLVEHCLCPLDPPKGAFVHTAEYVYWQNRNRKIGTAVVNCQLGLRPSDEKYLWKLLRIVKRQSQEEGEIYAGPRYLLRELGLSEGGRSARDLRQIIHRIGNVTYRDENFYDPVLKERRDRSFKFFSYDLPKDNEAFRPWYIGFDRVFWKMITTAGGYLDFDDELYDSLRPASGRMFLWLKKVFYGERNISPKIDVTDFCIHQLGFSRELRVADYNRKAVDCARDLEKIGMLYLPKKDILRKNNAGRYETDFQRGPYVERTPDGYKGAYNVQQDALYEPLKEKVGLNDAVIRKVLRQPKKDIALWIDVTLAAVKEKGKAFFKESPQAFFMHGLYGDYGPPDWYQEYNKTRDKSMDSDAQEVLSQKCGIKLGQTESKQTPRTRSPEEYGSRLTIPQEEREFEAYLYGDEGKEYFTQLMSDIFEGNPGKAREYMRRKFVEDRKHQSVKPQATGSMVTLNAKQ